MLINLQSYVSAIKSSLGFSGPNDTVVQWINQAIHYYSAAATNRRIQGLITGNTGDQFLTLPDYWITTEFNKSIIANINTGNAPNSITQHFSPYRTGYNSYYNHFNNRVNGLGFNGLAYNRGLSQFNANNVARNVAPPPLRVQSLNISTVTVGSNLVTRLYLQHKLTQNQEISVLYDALHIIDATQSTIPDADSHYIIDIARVYFRVYLLDKNTIKQASIDIESEIQKILDPLRPATTDNGDNLIWRY